MDSFIVDVWERFLGALTWISPFRLLIELVPRLKDNYCFTDTWLLGHLIFAVTSLGLSSSGIVTGWEWLVIVYAVFRVLEVLVYQLHVLVCAKDPVAPKKDVRILGPERLLIIAVQNYLEIVIWFAFFYRNSSGMFGSNHIQLDSFTGAVYFSLVTIATVGYGDIKPVAWGGASLVTAEITVGLFMALIVLGRLVGMLPELHRRNREHVGDQSPSAPSNNALHPPAAGDDSSGRG